MMQYVDFGNVTVAQLRVCDLVAPTVDANSLSVDLKEHDGCLFHISLGESNDTLSGSVFIEFEVESSDDNSTFTDVPDADLSASVTGTNTGTIALIDAAAEDAIVVTSAYLGRDRFVRVVVNVTGSHTNGTPLAISAILTRDKYT